MRSKTTVTHFLHSSYRDEANIFVDARIIVGATGEYGGRHEQNGVVDDGQDQRLSESVE